MTLAGKILIGALAIGGIAIVATALSHPAKPTLAVRSHDDGSFTWEYVDADGTVVAQSDMKFDTAAEARAAGEQAGSS